jgi:predicted nucleic-acid-binding protein
VADGRSTFEDRHRVAAALDLFQRRKGDLADHLLGLRGESKGARTTFTFDRDLEWEPRFTLMRG